MLAKIEIFKTVWLSLDSCKSGGDKDIHFMFDTLVIKVVSDQ